MSAATITATMTRVAPIERVHTVRIETFASALGFQIANRSMTMTIEALVDLSFAHHSIFDADIAGVSAAIEGEIKTDLSRRDDLTKAVSAVDAVLEDLFGSTMNVTGWVAGEQQLINGDVFEFTGHACAGCGVNPEAVNRTYRGVRCANSADCGHTVRF